MSPYWRHVVTASVVCLLGACGTKVPQAQPALPADLGTLVFQRCVQCHSATDESRPAGPGLRGIVGRPAATSAGYFYSDALRRSGITWNAAKLDAFLANPQVVVPGTFMLVGVPLAEERSAVIAYLASH